MCNTGSPIFAQLYSTRTLRVVFQSTFAYRPLVLVAKHQHWRDVLVLEEMPCVLCLDNLHLVLRHASAISVLVCVGNGGLPQGPEASARARAA